MKTRPSLVSLFLASAIAIATTGCGKSAEQQAAEDKAADDYAERMAMECANRAMISLDMVDSATKKIPAISVCPVDFRSGKTICPSSTGGVRFVFSESHGIPQISNKNLKYPSVEFTVVLEPPNLGEKTFLCWFDDGNPVHIVSPKVKGTRVLLDDRVVYSLIPK